MGNQQPKKISKVTKTQIDIGALKAKIHLQLMRDRKNAEVIKAEKQLINKIKSKSRNRTEQILVAERVVNGLKYAQACNQLMSYAISIRSQANFLAENLLFPEKLVPWLPQIYSLIYAADTLGLSSLKEFKDLMRALNDPVIVNKYIKPQIIDLLKPTPSPFELNIYILEFSERNNIPLQEINLPGHKFSKDLPPPQDQPSMKDDSFYDLQKKLADELQNKLKTNDNSNQNKGGPNGNGNNSGNNGGFGGSNSGNGGFGGNGGFNGNNGGFGGSSSGNGGLGGNNGYGGNNGGFGGNNGGFGGNGGNTGIPGWGGQGGNNGGFGGNNGGFGGNGGNTGIPGWGGQGGNNGGLGGNQNPGYYDFDKKPADKSSQSSNPYGIRDTYDPKANLANITNPLPQFYDNTIKSNPQNGKKPAQMTDSRMSINSIEQIDYYPQIEPPKAPKVIPDPDFDRICQILRAAM